MGPMYGGLGMCKNETLVPFFKPSDVLNDDNEVYEETHNE